MNTRYSQNHYYLIILARLKNNNNTLYLFWQAKTSEIPYTRLLGGLEKNAKKQPNPIPGLIHTSTPHISSHSRTLSPKKQHAAATLLYAHGHPRAARPRYSSAECIPAPTPGHAAPPVLVPRAHMLAWPSASRSCMR
jgi:hypothetical protein